MLGFITANSVCKACTTKAVSDYTRTKIGLITRIYSHQRDNCRKRGYKYPEYSIEELREWCLSQPKYHEQFKLWEDNSCNFRYTPSIDRLDDYKTYSFDNIQIISTIENIRKANFYAKTGVTRKMCRTIYQYDINNIFLREYFSLKEAERITGITIGRISNCCSGRTHIAGGFVWKYKRSDLI